MTQEYTPEEQATLDKGRAELHRLVDAAFDGDDVRIVAVIYHNDTLGTHIVNFDAHEAMLAMGMTMRQYTSTIDPVFGLAAQQSEGKVQ